MNIHDKITDAENRFKKLIEGDKNVKCFLKSCDRKSIGSHSLSESRVLRLLEAKDLDNKITLFYLGDELIGDRQRLELTFFNSYHQKLKSISKSKASVFYGFCDKHDNEIFDKLDNSCYSNNDHINFLHGYRAFSYFITKWINLISFHSVYIEPLNKSFKNSRDILNNTIEKMPELNRLNIPINFQLNNDLKDKLLSEIDDLAQNQLILDKDLLKNQIRSSIEPFIKDDKTYSGQEIDDLLKDSLNSLNQIDAIPQFNNLVKLGLNEKLKELEVIKNIIESIWSTKQFSNFLSTSCFLSNLFLISGSFVFEYNNQNISLTIIPEAETNRTYLIFGCLDLSYSTFFSQINIKDETELKKFVSKIILIHGSNIYISPNYWSILSQKVKEFWLTDRKDRIFSEDLNLFETFNN